MRELGKNLKANGKVIWVGKEEPQNRAFAITMLRTIGLVRSMKKKKGESSLGRPSREKKGEATENLEASGGRSGPTAALSETRAMG